MKFGEPFSDEFPPVRLPEWSPAPTVGSIHRRVFRKHLACLDRIDELIIKLRNYFADTDMIFLEPSESHIIETFNSLNETLEEIRKERPRRGNMISRFLSGAATRDAEALETALTTLQIQAEESVTKIATGWIRDPGLLYDSKARQLAILAGQRNEPLPELPDRSARLILPDGSKYTIIVSFCPANLGGAFGEIYLGYHHAFGDLALKRDMGGRVSFSAESRKRAVLREGDLWLKAKHPNILPFIGTCVFQDRLHLVSPYLKDGTLLPYLQEHPNVSRLKILRDLASAFAHIHSLKPRIFHSDIKAENVLVRKVGSKGNDVRVFVCDFGLSKEEGTTTSRSMQGTGTIVHMSPERIRGNGRSMEDDVWAFGILMASVLRAAKPYGRKLVDLDMVAIHDAIVNEGVRPDIGVGPEWNLAAECWNLEPSIRPTMKKIHVRLMAMVADPGDSRPRPRIKASRFLGWK